MARKTFPVDALTHIANRMIARAKTPDERRALASLLAEVLHETGNYKGFRYDQSEISDDGKLRDGHDDTRRHYHC